MRKVGKLDKRELEAWQKRQGLQVDGIFGNQSMGQVIKMERELMRRISEFDWLGVIIASVLGVLLLISMWSF